MRPRVQAKDGEIERAGLTKCTTSGCWRVGGPSPPPLSRDAASRADRPSDFGQDIPGDRGGLNSSSVEEQAGSGAKGNATNTNGGFQLDMNLKRDITATAAGGRASRDSDNVSAVTVAAADGGLPNGAAGVSESAGANRPGWDQPNLGAGAEAVSSARGGRGLPLPPLPPLDSSAGAAPQASPPPSGPPAWQGAADLKRAHQLRLSLLSERALEDWWPLMLLAAAAAAAAAAAVRRRRAGGRVLARRARECARGSLAAAAACSKA